MTTHRACAAFTLVELILASTVTALVAGSAVLILTQVTAAQDRVRRQMEMQQEARAALHSIAHALRNSHRPTEQEENRLRGRDDFASDAPADSIRFFTISPRIIRPGQPQSDVHEVEFFLFKEDDARDFNLMRRTDPTRNVEPDEGGVVERVAANVVGLNVTYFDGARWHDKWIDDVPAYPQAVRIEIYIRLPDNDLYHRASGIVNVPYRPGLAAEAGSNERS